MSHIVSSSMRLHRVDRRIGQRLPSCRPCHLSFCGNGVKYALGTERFASWLFRRAGVGCSRRPLTSANLA